MRNANLCFFVSLACGLIACGVAAANNDYYCMSTPIGSCPNPCGCPTDVEEDVCSAAVPMLSYDMVTDYYCVGWAGFNCTWDTRSCGGEVYECPKCYDCAGPNCQCGGGECTQTEKTGFCNNTYGCT